MMTGTPAAINPPGEMLLVKKPAGWTSFDAVHRLRHILGVKKIGHAGTLDPLATGLLIVCTGKMTKKIDLYAGLEKEYDAEITLGGRTESFDAESPVIDVRGLDGITEGMIAAACASFIGTQQQTPPMWSAVKVRGKRLYKYARKGETVERRSREITVSSFRLNEVALPVIRCTIVCTKGTYIRSIANDLGERLGCGAYLSGLVRTRIGAYRIEDALTPEEIANGAPAGAEVAG